MWHKIAVAGATGAAVLGVGVAALAASGSPTTGSGTAGTGTAKAHHQRAHGALRHALRHALHGQVTVRRDGAYLVRSGVRGTVSSVSATSISVKAEDGFSARYTITKDTKVRERGSTKGTGTPSSVSAVHPGDHVAVLGSAPATSTADPSAKVIVDGLR